MLKLEAPGGSTKILLHSCCAPCSGAILECMLANGLRPTIFFSNSNIVPREEYELRKAELSRYAASLGLEVVDDDYDHRDWLSAVRGLEREPERGARCLQCFKYRLCRAARYASEHGFEVLATTLASSRWKDLAQVDEAGEYSCSLINGQDKKQPGDVNVTWWKMNWRKGGLQPRRNEIIREQQFYNQLFCGCEFARGATSPSSTPASLQHP